MNDHVVAPSRGVSGDWHVAPDYGVQSGRVCPLNDDGEPLVGADRFSSWDQRPTEADALGDIGQHPAGHTYFPMSRPELPAELAKAATGAEKDLLRFTRRYGGLGYRREMLSITRVGTLLDGKGAGAHSVEGTGELVPGGDEPGEPVSWLLAHAETVRLVLQLYGRLDDEPALSSFLETLKISDGPALLFVKAATRGRNYRTCRGLVLEPNATSRNVAMLILTDLLNNNLSGGIRREIGPEGDSDKIQSVFRFINLLDCVYWHLADAVTGGWVRRCADPECGAFFAAKSERVKYCPPAMGNKGVSPCMNRHKQRKHRRKKRGN